MKKRQRFIRHAMATAMRKGSYQKNFASPNEKFLFMPQDPAGR